MISVAGSKRLLAKRFGSDIENGHDDLDAYQGAAAWLDEFPFAVMHYRGTRRIHPRSICSSTSQTLARSPTLFPASHPN
jgi:hypothetical protein